MGDLHETGLWIVAVGVAGTILWNAIQYLRKPAFVSRARLDDLYDEITRLRADIAGLRVEVSDLKTDNVTLTARVKALLAECEFWRDQYRDLKAKGERRSE